MRRVVPVLPTILILHRPNPAIRIMALWLALLVFLFLLLLLLLGESVEYRTAREEAGPRAGPRARARARAGAGAGMTQVITRIAGSNRSLFDILVKAMLNISQSN